MIDLVLLMRSLDSGSFLFLLGNLLYLDTMNDHTVRINLIFKFIILSSNHYTVGLIILYYIFYFSSSKLILKWAFLKILLGL